MADGTLPDHAVEGSISEFQLVELKISSICFRRNNYTRGRKYDDAAAMHTIAIVNIIWFLLALCFIVAFCLYKFSLKLPNRLEDVFQDLIRYGKTKEHIKRPSWQLFFNVSKRWFGVNCSSVYSPDIMVWAGQNDSAVNMIFLIFSLGVSLIFMRCLSCGMGCSYYSPYVLSSWGRHSLIG